MRGRRATARQQQTDAWLSGRAEQSSLAALRNEETKTSKRSLIVAPLLACTTYRKRLDSGVSNFAMMQGRRRRGAVRGTAQKTKRARRRQNKKESGRPPPPERTWYIHTRSPRARALPSVGHTAHSHPTLTHRQASVHPK